MRPCGPPVNAHPPFQVENEARVNLPAKQGTSPEQTSALEESLFKISGQMSTITRNQKYFRTRENRNFSTVRSTEQRIVNFTFIQIALIICMGALQVFIVRFFFQVRDDTTLVADGRLTMTTGREEGLCMRGLVSMVLGCGSLARRLSHSGLVLHVYHRAASGPEEKGK